jgi:transposase
MPSLDQAAEKAGVSYHSLQRLARAYGVTAEALAGEEARD